jgi:hypothetical protein
MRFANVGSPWGNTLAKDFAKTPYDADLDRIRRTSSRCRRSFIERNVATHPKSLQSRRMDSSSFACFSSTTGSSSIQSRASGTEVMNLMTSVESFACTKNLNLYAVVMKSAKNRLRTHDSGLLNRARDRRILVQ